MRHFLSSGDLTRDGALGLFQVGEGSAPEGASH
jgi:hypothetical protein